MSFHWKTFNIAVVDKEEPSADMFAVWHNPNISMLLELPRADNYSQNTIRYFDRLQEKKCTKNPFYNIFCYSFNTVTIPPSLRLIVKGPVLRVIHCF